MWSAPRLGTTSRNLSKASFRPFIRRLSRAFAAKRRRFNTLGDGGISLDRRLPLRGLLVGDTCFYKNNHMCYKNMLVQLVFHHSNSKSIHHKNSFLPKERNIFIRVNILVSSIFRYKIANTSRLNVKRSIEIYLYRCDRFPRITSLFDSHLHRFPALEDLKLLFLRWCFVTIG